ncbi:MAG: glycosyltransferase, partial [Candidatus Sericytochromatia bacterium]
MPIETSDIPYPARVSEYLALQERIRLDWEAGDLQAALAGILAYFDFRLELDLLRRLLLLLVVVEQAERAELAAAVRVYLGFFFAHPLQLENYLQQLQVPQVRTRPDAAQLEQVRRLFSPAEPRPRVSVCMVVRNEADLLGRCLESVRLVMDELVLVDTGSDDGTPELARQLVPEAIILERPWDNDFSIPRNLKLEAASGDWIFILDADQELNCESLGRLQAFFSYRPIGLTPFLTYVYNYAPEPEPESIEPFRNILPNSRELRYFGYGHSHLYHTRVPLHLLPLQLEGVWLGHSGFLSGQLQKHGKTDQRLARLQKGLADPAHTYPRLRYYQVIYQMLDKAYAEALDNLLFCWQAWREHGDCKPDLHWENAPLGFIGLQLFRIWTALDAPEKIVTDYPQLAVHSREVEFHFLHAQALKRTGRLAQARLAAIQLFDPELGVSYPHQGWQSWQPAALLLELALESRNLPEALGWAGMVLADRPSGTIPGGSMNVRQVQAQLCQMAQLGAADVPALLRRRALAAVRPEDYLDSISLYLALTPAAEWPLQELFEV